ncbi:hypothetical protein BT96DRAFT_919457 [Gymnopus androsaceus JB14]|uniref:Uncharacterized protein n=1 Tax=Gymnopus androsaceus JB14 TaxID=1447944 RepID=A0A6A4HSZ2_9AGAR|nr:hypothetical protein BT96DRAFT_919457 [Gymnopus androsaceus JB14]
MRTLMLDTLGRPSTFGILVANNRGYYFYLSKADLDTHDRKWAEYANKPEKHAQLKSPFKFAGVATHEGSNQPVNFHESMITLCDKIFTFLLYAYIDALANDLAITDDSEALAETQRAQVKEAQALARKAAFAFTMNITPVSEILSEEEQRGRGIWVEQRRIHGEEGLRLLKESLLTLPRGGEKKPAFEWYFTEEMFLKAYEKHVQSFYRFNTLPKLEPQSEKDEVATFKAYFDVDSRTAFAEHEKYTLGATPTPRLDSVQTAPI